MIRKFVKLVVWVELLETWSGKLPHAKSHVRQEVRGSLSQNIATSIAHRRPRNPNTSPCSAHSASQTRCPVVSYGTSVHGQFACAIARSRHNPPFPLPLIRIFRGQYPRLDANTGPGKYHGDSPGIRSTATVSAYGTSTRLSPPSTPHSDEWAKA